MGIVAILITVSVIIYGIWCQVYYKIPRTGPMYPQYMKGPSAYRTNEELYNSKSFICPWCRLPRAFPVGYKVYSWPPECVFCPDCQNEIRRFIQSGFQPTFTSEFSYRQIQNDARFWVICKDYNEGAIDQEKAHDLVEQICAERFNEQCLYEPTGCRTKSVRSINDLNDGWCCGVCGKDSGYCECNNNYIRDIRKKRYPKKLMPYLEQLQELDGDFVLSKYYILADWQNLTAIEHDVNTYRCSADFAKKRLDDYIGLIIADLQQWIDYFQKVAHGENSSMPSYPSANQTTTKLASATTNKRVGSELMKEYMT